MSKSEEQLLQALRERMLREIQDRPISGAPPINIYNGAMPTSVSEALSSTGKNSPGMQVQAQQAGISPEELEYLVDISKRDVKEQTGVDEMGQPVYRNVGWDKKVHRYTQPNAKKKKRTENSSLFGDDW